MLLKIVTLWGEGRSPTDGGIGGSV